MAAAPERRTAAAVPQERGQTRKPRESSSTFSCSAPYHVRHFDRHKTKIKSCLSLYRPLTRPAKGRKTATQLYLITNFSLWMETGLCTKNTSRALIERP